MITAKYTKATGKKWAFKDLKAIISEKLSAENAGCIKCVCGVLQHFAPNFQIIVDDFKIKGVQGLPETTPVTTD